MPKNRLLISATLISTLVFSMFSATPATAATTLSVEWDSSPAIGQPSPAFTMTLTIGDTPSNQNTQIGGFQFYVGDPTFTIRWPVAGSECFTAAACGVTSVKIQRSIGGVLQAEQDMPVNTLRSWPPTTPKGILFVHSDRISSAWGGFQIGDVITMTVNAGFFTVTDLTSSNPIIQLTEYVHTAYSTYQVGANGMISQTSGTSVVAPSAQGPTSSPQPVTSAIDVNPTNITVDNEIITILGANLNAVTEVYIGGVKVPIFTQSGNRLQIRAPKGLSGLVDLELKSSLNDVLMTKKLNFGGTTAVGTRKATLIVGGFAHNSRKLTARMQARIDRWLERNSDLSTLTCTGFTSLPRRTTDVTLSTNRGKTACNFSRRQRSELKTSVSQGIEDPKPGSNVRRVRLVLTP